MREHTARKPIFFPFLFLYTFTQSHQDIGARNFEEKYSFRAPRKGRFFLKIGKRFLCLYPAGSTFV